MYCIACSVTLTFKFFVFIFTLLLLSFPKIFNNFPFFILGRRRLQVDACTQKRNARYVMEDIMIGTNC
jgi:hypothetical protein